MDQLWGQEVWINWPFHHKAIVVGLMDETVCLREVRTSKGSSMAREAHPSREDWETHKRFIEEGYRVGRKVIGTGGMNIGAVQVVVTVKVLQGMEWDHMTGNLVPQWGRDEEHYPLQVLYYPY